MNDNHQAPELATDPTVNTIAAVDSAPCQLPEPTEVALPDVGAPRRGPSPDLEWVERAVRMGVSLRVVATEVGRSYEWVRKLANAHGWSKDLSGRIKERAQRRLAESESRKKRQAERPVRQMDAEVGAASTQEPGTKEEIDDTALVEDNAAVLGGVLERQRGDIGRARVVCAELLEEIEGTNRVGAEAMSRLIALLSADGGAGLSAVDAKDLRAALGLSGRVTNMQRLAETLKTLVHLERQAWGIEGGESEEGIEAVLSRMSDPEQ